MPVIPSPDGVLLRVFGLKLRALRRIGGSVGVFQLLLGGTVEVQEQGEETHTSSGSRVKEAATYTPTKKNKQTNSLQNPDPLVSVPGCRFRPVQVLR